MALACKYGRNRLTLSLRDLRMVRYEHVITRAERSLPTTEPLGGILSDDMGLGKTLTTLAVIVGSKGRANGFGSGRSDGPVPGSPHQTASRATLVVVPSMCRCPPMVKFVKQR